MIYIFKPIKKQLTYPTEHRVIADQYSDVAYNSKSVTPVKLVETSKKKTLNSIHNNDSFIHAPTMIHLTS